MWLKLTSLGGFCGLGDEPLDSVNKGNLLGLVTVNIFRHVRKTAKSDY